MTMLINSLMLSKYVKHFLALAILIIIYFFMNRPARSIAACLLVFITWIPLSSANAQNELETLIHTLMDRVHIDSLKSHVMELENAGGTRSRITFTAGKDSAAVYIQQVFESMPGLTSVELDTFYIPGAVAPYNTRPQVNVVATLRGTVYPDEYYVIGSHYDSVSDRDPAWNNGVDWQTIQAPGANDNGSGVAALLEMARIMSDPSSGFSPKHTIKFVAFGAEERLPSPVGVGNHWGSKHMARQARIENHQIIGMVSVDMIGFNERFNYAAIVKVNNDMASQSAALGARYAAANDNFFTQLIMNSFPFANGVYSDHQSFADEGYPAILIIENAAPWNTNQYYTANPYYHKISDTHNRINFEQVKRVTKLNIAALAWETGTVTSMDSDYFEELPVATTLKQNYPNPFNPTTHIPFTLGAASHVRLEIFDTMGRLVTVLKDEILSQGEYRIRYDAQNHSSGIYLARLIVNGAHYHSVRMTLIR